jgi:glycosyltransferase involved in cell wall biosynthesis
MITKNEEFKLKRCLESVKDIVNEIIIVDTGSTDKTKDIALEFGAKIYDYKWDDNFANARNYAVSKSSGDWNLILDADEFITNIDLDSVYKFMDSKDSVIGQIKIVNLFEQDGEIRKSNSFISRLAPNGIYFSGSIHEQLDCSYPRKRVVLLSR